VDEMNREQIPKEAFQTLELVKERLGRAVVNVFTSDLRFGSECRTDLED
jgi:hypothetical protein